MEISQNESDLLDAAKEHEEQFQELPGFCGIGLGADGDINNKKYFVEILIDPEHGDPSETRSIIPGTIMLDIGSEKLELPLRVLDFGGFRLQNAAIDDGRKDLSARIQTAADLPQDPNFSPDRRNAMRNAVALTGGAVTLIVTLGAVRVLQILAQIEEKE